MFEIEYRCIGEYRYFSYRNTLRAAKREAKNLGHYGGWANIRIKKPDGSYLQVSGE